VPQVLFRPAWLEPRAASGAGNDKAGGLPLVLMGAVQVAARRARELEAWLDVRVREDCAWKSQSDCPITVVPRLLQ